MPGRVVVQRFFGLAVPIDVEAFVHQDSVHPAVEAVLRIERREALVGLDEGILRCVLRVFGIAEHSERHGIHHLLISAYQHPEGLGLARQGLADQFKIFAV